ncbi:hypothetical protein KGF54_003786, partial [Candida jiufengensis]|uniref:uncharacterized protein n=1 Tax=Candida jiufengensis TaxID=497108 RepID=UPI0022247FCC
TATSVPQHPYRNIRTATSVPQHPYRNIRTAISVPQHPYRNNRTATSVPQQPYRNIRTATSIPGYAELTSELYDLVTKSKSSPINAIDWTRSAHLKFNYLRKVLISAPILQSLNLKQPITLHCDASDVSWAGVLQNIDDKNIPHLVSCYSGKFHLSEKNYTIYEKELFAIYNTLIQVQSLLIGYTGVIHIYTDNKALSQVLDKPLSNSHFVNRLYKWLNFLRNFNYEIHHISGSSNVIADALTRCYDEKAIPKSHFAVEEVIKSLKSKLPDLSTGEETMINSLATSASYINDYTKSDEDFMYKKIYLKDIKYFLYYRKVPPRYDSNDHLRKKFIFRAHEFYIHQDIMYKIGKDGQFSRKVLFLHKDVVEIFKLVHDKRGHLKLDNAFKVINQSAFIPNLYKRLKKYIDSCDICQKYTSTHNERDPLYLHLPAGPWHTIVCDTVKINGKSLVVARDEFTGWSEAIVLTKLTGENVADFIFSSFIARVGYFDVFKTDNGPEFRNQFVATMLKKYGVKHKFSIQYHPQGNGMSERGHQSFINFFKKLPDITDWEKFLPCALWVDRTNVRSRTGFSSQYLVYGFQGYSDLNTITSLKPETKLYSEDELFKFRFKQLYFKEIQLPSAYYTQERQRTQHKLKFDTKHELTNQIRVGDLVLVWDKPTPVSMLHSKKLDPRWSGPYLVNNVNNNIYKLKSLSGLPLNRQFTREMLKKYISRN